MQGVVSQPPTNLWPTVRWLRQIVPFDGQRRAATTITDLAVLTKTLAKDHTVPAQTIGTVLVACFSATTTAELLATITSGSAFTSSAAYDLGPEAPRIAIRGSSADEVWALIKLAFLVSYSSRH